jgi:Concanavalin A-like lectin/glucanases superfamily
MFKAACCIAASVLLFLPIAAWVISVEPVKPAEYAALADRYVIPDLCRPQPGPTHVYLIGAVFLSASLFGTAFAWRRWGNRLPLGAGLVWGLEVAFVVGLAVMAWLALLGDDYYHLRLNLFFKSPLLAVPLLSAAFLAMRWDWGSKRFVRPLMHLIALGLAGMVVLGSLFDDKGEYTGGLHFTAVFFPVVQVYEGKALLIDCASQYGLYPHLLQPLFALTGLTILRFSLVMGLLTGGSYLALWAFLWRACENKSAALIGFAALLFNCWFSFVNRAGLDLYFQYLPIRFVFPALLVFFAWRQFYCPTRWLYWSLLTFLAVGVLWNLDAGLPALLAWMATLCFAELFGRDWRGVARRVACHLAAAGCVLTAVVALYSGVIRLRYGAFPDYGQFFHYQRLYFVAGYYRLPFTLPSPWMLVVLTYLAGLAYAAFALVARRDSPRAKIIFLLSVLGVGLSSYYQVRSHPIVLLLVWWPCQILLALFLDELLLRLKHKPASLLPWCATAVLAWFLVGSACSLAPELRLTGKAVAANYRQTSDPKVPKQRQEEAALLTRLVPPGEKVVIAAPHAALIHLASKRPAVNPSSLFQMVLMDEFHQLEQLLAQSPSTFVLIDKGTLALEGWQRRDRGLQEFAEFLQKRYEVAAMTESSVLFARRPEGEPLLDRENQDVQHLSVRAGAPLTSLRFAPFSTKAAWSMEMIVKPAGVQAPNAALVGNHPGLGTGGFVIHQETPGVWALVVGDGKAWQPILQFNLRAGEWNYLALVRTQDAFTLYLDGRLAAARIAPGLKIEESPLLLQVGNWVANDRPFNGDVKEFRVLNRALASAEIAAAAERVRTKLP